MDARTNAACDRWKVLVVGDQQAAEFAETLTQLSGLLETEFVENAASALRRMAENTADRPYVLIVVLTPRPGAVDTAELDALRRAAPLARFVALLGNWCEGETRTGRPWPADDRILWYHAPWQIEREIARLRQGKCPAWGLPPTMSIDERLVWSAREPLPQTTGLVLVCALNRESSRVFAEASCQGGLTAIELPWTRRTPLWRESLEDLRTRFQTTGGWKAASMPQAECPLSTGAEAGISAIWQAGRCDADEAQLLAKFAGSMPGVRIVAVADFPTFDLCQRLLASGAAAVLGWPLWIDELFEALVGRCPGSKMNGS